MICIRSWVSVTRPGQPRCPAPSHQLVGRTNSRSSSSGLSFRSQAACPQLQRPRAAGRCRSRAAAMLTAAVQQGAGDSKTKVLFLCLGNICRSPTAEAVFKKVVEDAGVGDRFEIDSCGTGGGSSNWYLPNGFSYHEGDPADPRMTRTAAQRGIKLTSRSRPLTPADLREFDYILGMDASNLAAIRRAAQHWAAEHDVPADYAAKVGLMTDHLRDAKLKQRFDSVPDPYYNDCFDLVLDLLEDACGGLLEDIQAQQRGQQGRGQR